MSIEAMKQALEALEYPGPSWPESREKTAQALRQAIEQAEKNQFNPDWDAMAVMVEEQQRMAKRIEELEQAEKQEPESFEQWNAKQHGDPEEIGFLQALRIAYCAGQDSVTKATPTTAQREWVGLTDEEREQATGWSVEHIEQALKEKNT